MDRENIQQHRRIILAKPHLDDDADAYLDYDLIRIPRRNIYDLWPHVLPNLLKGMHANPNMDMDEILEGLLDQSVQLWVVIPKDGRRELTAVFLTSVERDKGEWVLSLYGLGGQHPKKWVMACHAAMHRYAKQQECRRVRMCGRPAWQRILPGYAVVGEKQGHLIYERAVV
jgi:hypothetical protein